MSTSYSVFVETDLSFDNVKSDLERILNCQLQEDNTAEWDIYRVVLLGLEISLLEAVDFDDNNELKLSKYNYYIDIDYIPNAFDINYEADWRLMASMVIGNMVSKNLQCECIAVKNLQILLAMFLPEK